MSESTDMESRANPSHQASSNPAEQHGSPPESTKPGTSKNGAKWTSSGIITQQEKDNAYLKTAKIVQEYSDDLVDGWNKEIDTLLVFAALYSAILTAFNVQSYQYLQPVAPDPTLAVLQQILSLQLNSLAITPPINSTYGASTSTTNDQTGTQARAPSWAVALNILWFSALILSLASTSIGIMVKQWLRAYQNGCSGVAQESARLRQLRLNNLEKWRVAEIVAILPVLLQLSLWLFFGGLLVLLWQLDPTVATVTSALVGIVMLAVVGMTILPVICRSCAYLSPPAFAFLYVKQHVEYGLKFGSKTVGLLLSLPFVQVAGPLMRRSLLSPQRYVTVVGGWSLWAHSASHDVTFTTWRGQEKATIQESSSELDIDTIVSSYAATMDLNGLVDAAVPILIEQDPDEVDRCFACIRAIIHRHHPALEVSADISVQLREHLSRIQRGGLVQWLEGKATDFQDFDPDRTQTTVLFVLSAAVMAHGRETLWAGNILRDVVRASAHQICYDVPWHTLRHVVTAMVKLTQRYLDPPSSRRLGPFTMDIASKPFRETSRLFRLLFSVPGWSKDESELKAFLALVFQMAIHLQQYLLRVVELPLPPVDAMEILSFLRETLECLFHHEYGMELIADRSLHKAVVQTVGRIEASAERQVYPWYELSVDQELKSLKKTIGIYEPDAQAA